MLLAIAVLAAIAFYFMKPDERTSVLGQLHTLLTSAYESSQGGPREWFCKSPSSPSLFPAAMHKH